MADEVLLVLSTFPDRATARRIAEELVHGRFAACANVASAVDSIYRWKDEVETASEVLVFFKTTSSAFRCVPGKIEITTSVTETPEIISFRIDDGSADYLRWVCGKLLSVVADARA